MVYYNLKVTLMLKEDIKYENTYEKLANLISLSMLNNEKMKEFHEKNCYKFYNFCSLYPFEKDGIYKKNKIYIFDIRFVDLQFATTLKQLLDRVNGSSFKIIMSNLQVNEYRKINKLISLTPCVLTTPKGDYDIKDDLELVKTRITANAEKKYKEIYNEKISCDFIKSITKINRTPIKLPYKNMHFLGNKFEIEVEQDENSQKLAYLLLSTGTLEKNSIGFGFVKAR
ncbi:MAG: CRISPR-associated endoribonuclease Cas6 [Clostridia bacterium]|nr:CRISPR-associated endoribonuclease Cas6 [Clostridia bacterium]